MVKIFCTSSMPPCHGSEKIIKLSFSKGFFVWSQIKVADGHKLFLCFFSRPKITGDVPDFEEKHRRLARQMTNKKKEKVWPVTKCDGNGVNFAHIIVVYLYDW